MPAFPAPDILHENYPEKRGNPLSGNLSLLRTSSFSILHYHLFFCNSIFTNLHYLLQIFTICTSKVFPQPRKRACSSRKRLILLFWRGKISTINLPLTAKTTVFASFQKAKIAHLSVMVLLICQILQGVTANSIYRPIIHRLSAKRKIKVYARSIPI